MIIGKEDSTERWIECVNELSDGVRLDLASCIDNRVVPSVPEHEVLNAIKHEGRESEKTDKCL